MAVERGMDAHKGGEGSGVEDSVVTVRRLLGRAEEGKPLFRAEQLEGRCALLALNERLRRLKAGGVEFAEIELSVYARQLLGDADPISLVS